MFKKLFNLINKKKDIEFEKNKNYYLQSSKDIEEVSFDEISLEKDIDKCNLLEDSIIEHNQIKVEKVDILEDTEQKLNEFLRENKEYINNIKIKREKGIRSIDLYNEEVLEFKTYKECSKKLKIPVAYIKENLKYGHTDYLGGAINYLRRELGEVVKDECEFLDSSKTPIELFNELNNKIFSSRVSENRRNDILSSDKIEPIKMHYKFEFMDYEYDDYFKKYGAIIKRGGNKKIELLNQKGEVIEVFKSISSCSEYLNKDKNEITEILKYGYSKVGRCEIRYSLRNI